MAPSSSSMMIVAGASALLVAAAATQFFPSSKNQERSIEELDEDEIITPEMITKIFDRLFLEMQAVLAQLSQQIQQIQMSGQQIPEPQLRQLLKAEFERALQARQVTVFEEFDVDAECVEEATWEFMDKEEDYPKVVRAVERFQKLYENVSGESVVGKRSGKAVEEAPVEILSPEKSIAAAEVYFEALTSAMRDVVESTKAEGRDLSDKQVSQEVQMKFASVANEAGENALEAMGISLKSFQSSLEKSAGDPQVSRALTMLQMKQQQEIMAMGVTM